MQLADTASSCDETCAEVDRLMSVLVRRMETRREAEGRQRLVLLQTMRAMEDQIQTLQKSLRTEILRADDTVAQLAQSELDIENLKQDWMDEVVEASHASVALKNDLNSTKARLTRADEILKAHAGGIQGALEKAAQVEEMVTRFQCALSEICSVLALAKDRERREAAAAAAARNDLITVQQRFAVETASHAAERKGLEAKLVMAKDVRRDLEAKLTAKEEEISIARKEIAELLSNMQQFEALIPLLKCELKLHKWRSSSASSSQAAGHDAPV